MSLELYRAMCGDRIGHQITIDNITYYVIPSMIKKGAPNSTLLSLALERPISIAEYLPLKNPRSLRCIIVILEFIHSEELDCGRDEGLEFYHDLALIADYLCIEHIPRYAAAVWVSKVAHLYVYVAKTKITENTVANMFATYGRYYPDYRDGKHNDLKKHLADVLVNSHYVEMKYILNKTDMEATNENLDVCLYEKFTYNTQIAAADKLHLNIRDGSKTYGTDAADPATYNKFVATQTSQFLGILETHISNIITAPAHITPRAIFRAILGDASMLMSHV